MSRGQGSADAVSSTDGFVLRSVDYRESDRILSVLTAERGRVEVRAPQARKSRKRFGGLDLFVKARLRFRRRAGAPRLEEAEVLEGFPGIREDIVRLALASYAAELLVQATAEEHASPDFFRLADAALRSLDRRGDADVGGMGWARAFELKLLHVLGTRPALRACASTGVDVGPDSGLAPLRWSMSLGGVLAPGGAADDPFARTVPADVIHLLDRALHLPLSQQAEVPWTPRQESIARGLVVPWVEEHVGRRDKARRFLEELAAPASGDAIRVAPEDPS